MNIIYKVKQDWKKDDGDALALCFSSSFSNASNAFSSVKHKGRIQVKSWKYAE
jgi:uncharacterized protein YxeA